MKHITFITLLLSITFTGCQKQFNNSETDLPLGQKSPDIIQFEVADQKIGFFLNKLDNPKTPLRERKQILCKDYPEMYAKKYVPALLKRSQQYNREELELDLKKVLDFYKVRDGIKC